MFPALYSHNIIRPKKYILYWKKKIFLLLVLLILTQLYLLNMRGEMTVALQFLKIICHSPGIKVRIHHLWVIIFSLSSNQLLFSSKKKKKIFKPLKLPTFLHQYPSRGFKILPSFLGEEEDISTEQHILEFEYFLDKFQIIYEDVALRMFFHSLK